jgi:predicted enzyme related to lactoylglutathione lyase
MAGEPLCGEVRIATVRTLNWVAMVRYYRDCVGLKERFVDEASQYAMFDAGPIRIALEGPAKPALPRAPGSGAVILNLEVPDLPRAVSGLQANGVQLQSELRQGPGYLYVGIADPEGNQHIVYQRSAKG